VKTVGDRKLAERVRDVSIRLYSEAADYAAQRGIIIADTKFEFGTDDGRARPDRRGADARLVALLAGANTAPASARRASTSSSCATGWRRSRGTRKRPRRGCRPTCSSRPPEKYREALRSADAKVALSCRPSTRRRSAARRRPRRISTETVYGLGADASNAEAIKKDLRGQRPAAQSPADRARRRLAEAKQWAGDVPMPRSGSLNAYWPGRSR
jgi:hypothetical protein